MLVVVPALIKPGSKLIGWAIPVLYEDRQDRYIPYFEIKPVFWIREKTQVFPVYEIDTTNPRLPQVRIKDTEEVRGEIALDSFVDQYFEPIGEIDITYNNDIWNVYNSLQKIYDTLVENIIVRPVPPLNYLVYDREKNILTRLYYIEKYNGKGVIKISKKGNILIEVSNVDILDSSRQNLRAMVRKGNFYMEVNLQWLNIITGGTGVGLGPSVEEVNELEEEEEE